MAPQNWQHGYTPLKPAPDVHSDGCDRAATNGDDRHHKNIAWIFSRLLVALSLALLLTAAPGPRGADAAVVRQWCGNDIWRNLGSICAGSIALIQKRSAAGTISGEEDFPIDGDDLFGEAGVLPRPWPGTHFHHHHQLFTLHKRSSDLDHCCRVGCTLSKLHSIVC